MIKLKRVYEQDSPADGYRFLVERLWPRGVRKSDLRLDNWIKDAGPSTELRKWFAHDPAKWDEFRRRYFAELDANPKALEPILKASRRGPVTLLYSSHDTEHNNAVSLRDYLERKLSKRRHKQAA
jgi:uncharacterized protein YeaO (DUF488 family)